MVQSDIEANVDVSQSALIIGATGAIGSAVLQGLLKSKNFNRVGECGRRVTDPRTLPAEAQGKLEQKILDFEHLDVSALRAGQWDVVFIALGTSQAAAGSAENFERIDRDYVLNAARAAKTEDSHPQTLVYVSAATADPASNDLYLRSKGLTEKGLAELGYDDFIVFRPGYLDGLPHPNQKAGEWMRRPFISLASNFSENISIDMYGLMKSILIAGAFGSASLRVDDMETHAWDGTSFTVIDNAAARRVHERVN